MRPYLCLLLLLFSLIPVGSVFSQNADVDVSLSIILNKNYGYVGSNFNFTVKITIKSNESTSLLLDYFVAFGNLTLENRILNVTIDVGANQSNKTVLAYNYSVIPNSAGVYLLNVTVGYTRGNESHRVHKYNYVTIGKRLVNGPINLTVGEYFTYNSSSGPIKFVVKEKINDTYYRVDIIVLTYNFTIETEVNVSNRRWYLPLTTEVLYLTIFVMPRYPYEHGDIVPLTDKDATLYVGLENVTLPSLNMSIVAYKFRLQDRYAYFDPGSGLYLLLRDKTGSIIEELIDTNVTLGTYIPHQAENTSEGTSEGGIGSSEETSETTQTPQALINYLLLHLT